MFNYITVKINILHTGCPKNVYITLQIFKNLVVDLIRIVSFPSLNNNVCVTLLTESNSINSVKCVLISTLARLQRYSLTAMEICLLTSV